MKEKLPDPICCIICERKLIVGEDMERFKRVDGKVICENCVDTFRAIKKMNDSIGKIYWKGIRLECKPCNIFNFPAGKSPSERWGMKGG
jgi:uncharacterized protein YbaR (Trm112 family)